MQQCFHFKTSILYWTRMLHNLRQANFISRANNGISALLLQPKDIKLFSHALLLVVDTRGAWYSNVQPSSQGLLGSAHESPPDWLITWLGDLDPARLNQTKKQEISPTARRRARWNVAIPTRTCTRARSRMPSVLLRTTPSFGSVVEGISHVSSTGSIVATGSNCRVEIREPMRHTRTRNHVPKTFSFCVDDTRCVVRWFLGRSHLLNNLLGWARAINRRSIKNGQRVWYRNTTEFIC